MLLNIDVGYLSGYLWFRAFKLYPFGIKHENKKKYNLFDFSCSERKV